MTLPPLRTLLAALLALALMVPGAARAATTGPQPELAALSELLSAPADIEPVWPASADSSAAEALSEAASALPSGSGLPTAERGMEAPARLPSPWPAEAPGSDIERPPRA